ncbi:CotY/CotZ family spore coat protein [Psychrobacillus sp. NEAU-3TGS]|uniref:CotY/CotZ family spore coat protein n=1 Tax=Psychrobacillus sp. NEAU-3TGS TaxID=2995412 RepID=UPI0024964FAC|nr:CotY/CotZ family spore coat protein [Psychrobacillus sp. NEAU-3TGS]MDI2589648.1 CotY/CotZ family spore coat protein [Psychrobacillus sp. NEAU-3TGS]
MGCGRNEDVTDVTRHDRGCVCDVVRAIKDIQDQATNDDCPQCPTNCFLEPLGGLVSPAARHRADTRVFMLLTKDGDPFKAFFRDTDNCDNDCISVFFRVEDIFDGCCATLRVLEPLDANRHEVDLLNEYGTQINLRKLCKVRNFRLTGSCITVDLNCFCAIECVADVFLNVCD